MKKLLLLLLATSIGYAQVPADATPLENIQITNNSTSTTATKVVVQESTGVLNTKPLDATVVQSSINPITGGAVYNGLAGKFPTPSGLTTNYLPKWNGSGFENSLVQHNGSELFIGGGLRLVSGNALNFNRPDNGAASSILMNLSNELVFTSPSGAQFNGTISASPAVNSNQVVVKSQLDLKANLASPAFTGVTTAPTATAGTNTTQVATTAFVLANANANGLLEFNTADRTVWNNGKGDAASNTSFGEQAMNNIGSGSSNSAFGRTALSNTTSGVSNTALGFAALNGNGIGSQNTGIGVGALSSNTSGFNNVAVGVNAGTYIADGTTQNTSSGSSVFIGQGSKALANSQVNQIVIGYNAVGAGSYTATIGDTTITKTVLRGVVQMDGYTVATLPAGAVGMTAYVTNALSPVSLAAVVGGGAVVVRVFHNGVTWIVQ